MAHYRKLCRNLANFDRLDITYSDVSAPLAVRSLNCLTYFVVVLFACGILSFQLHAQERETAEKLFSTNCASCHGAQRGGGQFGPALKGNAFNAKWRGGGVQALQSFLQSAMPPGASETISRAQHAALAAFLLGETPAATSKIEKADASKTGNPAADLGGMLESHHVGPIAPAPHIFADNIAKHSVSEREKLLAGLKPVTDEMLTNPPPPDWLSWRGTQGTTSYSPLNDINRKTVSSLKLAWSWSLPASSNEAAPLIHDGVMFVQSGETVEALDARDGTLLWRHKHVADPRFRGMINELHRNFALYGNHVLVATADRKVLALNMRDGSVAWQAPVLGIDQPGQIMSAGPVAARGTIIQPTTLGPQCRGGCAFVALDAATGKELWRTRTIASPGEPGGDTWNGAPASKRLGGGSWVAGSIDPDTGMLYAGTGGTYLVTPLLSDKVKGSTNDALYTDSTLAIDLKTGRIAWHHQHMPREVWDLDEAFERSLVRIPVNGTMQDVIVTIGKMGIIDILDRRTGKFLFAFDLGVQNLVSSIDPNTGRRTVNPDKEPKPNTPTNICPGPEGVRNWQATAFNAQNHMLFVPMGQTCMDWIWTPDSPASGEGIDIAWSLKPHPRSGGNFGRIDAIDLAKRKTLWSIRQRAPIASSLLASAGGLVFAGDRARYFRALDDRNGETLWSVRLNGVPSSSPASYSIDGKQYVVVVTGGGGPHDAQSISYTPEIMDPSAGVTIWVFTLPSEGSMK